MTAGGPPAPAAPAAPVPLVCAFAGQGAQHPGMGRALFARHREMVQAADAVVGYSVEELCQAADGRLDRTEYTQVAVFVVNALSYVDLQQRTGIAPAWLLGHSLGELNALLAAGAFDFETGLRIVQRRGQLMSRAEDGAMAALIGDRDRLLAFLRDPELDVALANDNSPGQVVAAGRRAAIEALERTIEDRGLGTALRLPVSGAFHSALMRPAMLELRAFLARLPLRAPEIPVISNVTAAPYPAGDVAYLLSEALVRPVRWVDSIHRLLATGPVLFQPLGPGRVVASLIRQILDAAPEVSSAVQGESARRSS